MIYALIDNGSLEAAAHRNLRAVAAALSARAGVQVRAVSWKHSNRISSEMLDDSPAWTLQSFVRSFHRLGQREFVLVPFFISAQGAIGSALRMELEQLQTELDGLRFRFTEGLAAAGVVPEIAAARIRECMAAHGLVTPPVIVVDHGGPSVASAQLRDELVAAITAELRGETGAIAAASMEGEHPPLLEDQLQAPGFAGRDVVVAPLFLSPGRHAGPGGDLARMTEASNARARLAELVGTHPLVIEALAGALQPHLTARHVHSFA